MRLDELFFCDGRNYNNAMQCPQARVFTVTNLWCGRDICRKNELRITGITARKTRERLLVKKGYKKPHPDPEGVVKEFIYKSKTNGTHKAYTYGYMNLWTKCDGPGNKSTRQDGVKGKAARKRKVAKSVCVIERDQV